ncbi:MAG TPA: imelysin family protein [Solirubrobacteraceae bacterium]
MLSGSPARTALATAAVLVALAGCGGGEGGHAADPPAQPYSKRSTAAGAVARVTPADYRRPVATYKRYVRRQLRALLGEVTALRSAIARGDLAGARAAWLKADARYESIGAAYGAFGELDAAVNGRPAGRGVVRRAGRARRLRGRPPGGHPHPGAPGRDLRGLRRDRALARRAGEGAAGPLRARPAAHARLRRPARRRRRGPTPDSGLLGPRVAPDGLTVTIAFGASLFGARDDQDWVGSGLFV